MLLHTMVYICGLYFALRSGNEHRCLRYSPSQIQLIEKPGSQAYLHYQEDMSKMNQGGLNTKSKQPKEVIQNENTTNPQRCFVCMYKVYVYGKVPF